MIDILPIDWKEYEQGALYVYNSCTKPDIDTWFSFAEEIFEYYDLKPMHTIYNSTVANSVGNYNRVNKRIKKLMKNIQKEDDYFSCQIHGGKWMESRVILGFSYWKGLYITYISVLGDKFHEDICHIFPSPHPITYGYYTNYPMKGKRQEVNYAIGGVTLIKYNSHRESKREKREIKYTKLRDEVCKYLKDGFIREVYPCNILSEKHLSKVLKIKGLFSTTEQTVESYIQTLVEKDLATLAPTADNMYVFKILSEKTLNLVRDTFEKTGLVLSSESFSQV